MRISIGKIVIYTLTESDARAINKRRLDAKKSSRAAVQDGVQIHHGNAVASGQEYPLVVSRVWENGLINGQVLLDGNDNLWVTSVPEKLVDGPNSLGVWKVLEL